MKLNLDGFEHRMNELGISFSHSGQSISTESDLKEYANEVMAICLENRNKEGFSSYDKLLNLFEYINEYDYLGFGDYQYLGSLDYENVSTNLLKQIYSAFKGLRTELDIIITSFKRKGIVEPFSYYKLLPTKKPKYLLRTALFLTYRDEISDYLGHETLFYILLKINELLLQFDYVLIDKLIYR